MKTQTEDSWLDVDFEEDLQEDEIFEDDGIFTVKGRTLLVDGDILLYKPCCIFNEDTDTDKSQIIRNIKNQLTKMLVDAEASSYRIFLTTNKNFRDFVADDYKANRNDIERPVNLRYTKNYLMDHMNAECEPYLEADDLLSIAQLDDIDNSVIWSLDKDLRQVEGNHLDEDSREVISISHLGEVSIVPNKKPTKHYFTGFKGLVFQGLVGDTADYIISCAKREMVTIKSGPNKGKQRLLRVGYTPKIAYELLSSCDQTARGYLEVLKSSYIEVFGDNWLEKLHQQMRLLYMIEEFNFETKRARMWDFYQKDVFMDVTTGIYHDSIS